jgi:hypothetical protein
MPLQMHLEADNPFLDRTLQEFAVNQPGNIILVGHHLSTSTQARCTIRTMSQSGATLDVGTGFDVPNHFFLEILGLRDEIGCTLVKREGSQVRISFNMLINAEFLHHVLRLGFEAES